MIYIETVLQKNDEPAIHLSFCLFVDLIATLIYEQLTHAL